MSNRRHSNKPKPLPSLPSSQLHQLDPPTDCLSRCQSEQHASLVLRCAATGNLELFKHCISLCSNPWNIRDSCGRNVLMVAASCGHLDIVLWLLKKTGRVFRVDSTDNESRWSALHRTAYYGHAGILIPLNKYGGNLDQHDYDKYTPLNILQYNTLKREMELLSKSYLYIWGNNSNMSLGHDHVRSSPELLQLPHDHGDIKQVVIRKFHSVFLTEDGRVYTCGHGHGGRLGHGNDKTCLSPKVVQSLKNEICVEVAAARNHTVFLSDSGLVYSCGLNDAHQLGHTPKNSTLSLPHSLSPIYLRSLKGVHVRSAGAGRYHTAVCTDKEIYTCGRNMGQLGYDKTISSQIQPKLVTGIYLDKDDSIAHFSVSDAATACVTKKKRTIFVCANYRVLRCERLLLPDSLSVKQFTASASLGELQSKQQKRKGQNSATPSNSPSGCGLTIGFTDSSNQLWLAQWADLTKKSSFMSPQLVPGSTKRNVAHFTLTKNLSIVTPQGEVFTGPLGTELPSLLTLKRVSNLQQATKVFTDYKANNMAVIQTVYSPPTLPRLERSSYSADIYGLLTEELLPGSVHDVTFQVAGRSLKANKLILSSHSSVFSSLFKSSVINNSKLIISYDKTSSIVALSLESSKMFELFLQYLYGGQLSIKSSCTPNKAIETDSPPSTSNSKTSLDESLDDLNTWTALYDKYGFERKNSYDAFNDLDFNEDCMNMCINPKDSPPAPVKNPILVLPGSVISYETGNIKEDLLSLKSLATAFKITELVKRLDSISSSHSAKIQSYSIKGPQIIVKQECGPHDVVIVSETGKRHYCHKSILVTRSDYFQSMLMMGWRETTNSDETELQLPIPDPLIEMVIHYLYTDHAPMVEESSSLDWLVSALIMADQLLLKRLKTLCELSLANILSLDNVGYIIDISEVYHAHQLQTSCIEFVCLNLTALLEMGGVEGVSTQILNKISDTYKEMHPSIKRRTPLILKELDMGEVPPSYLSNDIIESTDEEMDDNRTPSVTTPTYRAKSPIDTPTSGSKTTPTGNSARKKRRKKGGGSKIDAPRQLLFTTNDKKMNQNNESERHQNGTGPTTTEEIPSTMNGTVRDTIVQKEQETLNEPITKQNGGTRQLQPWGKRDSSNCTDKVDLRSIMSTEEEAAVISQIPPSHKPKLSHCKAPPTMPIAIPTKESLPQTGAEFQRSMSLPAKSPTSPWGIGNNESSIKVSLKSLMAAEAEAEKRKTEVIKEKVTIKHQQQSNHTSSCQQEIKVKRDRRTSFPPLSPSVVSFTDIVTNQQHELDCQLHELSHKKQFHLIQIEEQAIQGLMSLYDAHNNSNEFISIERVPSSSGISSSQVSSKRMMSSSSAPYTGGTTSAWNKKP